MKGDVFVARLAGGAVASTMACLMPQSHTEAIPSRVVGYEAAVTGRTALAEGEAEHSGNEATILTMSETPREWHKTMEREFRALALEEVKGTLNAQRAARLEELSHWRNVLLNPPTTEEILLQIKRDRLLEKTEELLRAYVEFEEATNKKGTAA